MAVKLPTALLVCATLSCLGGCSGTGASPHAGQPTLQGQSMQLMLADVDRIRSFLYGGDATQADADKAATDLLSWSRRMGELFPSGQASTDYVDMDPARVNGAPEAMTRTAEQLLAAVRTGKRPAIGDQLARAERDGCGFCHLSGYR
jgi:hypothetical protein